MALVSCLLLNSAAGCGSGPTPGQIPTDEDLIPSASSAPAGGETPGTRIWIRVQSYFTDDANLTAAGVQWEPAPGGAGAQGLRVGRFPDGADIAAAVKNTRRRGGNYTTQAVTLSSGGQALFDVTEVLPGAVTLTGLPEITGELRMAALTLEIQAKPEGNGGVRLQMIPIVRTYDKSARILRLESCASTALVKAGGAAALAGASASSPQALGTVFFLGRGEPPSRRVLVATVRLVE